MTNEVLKNLKLNMTNKGLLVAFCAGLLLMASPEVAEARYLDPGTGTMIIQVIVAAFATIFLFFRSAWTSLKMSVLKMLGKAPEIEE